MHLLLLLIITQLIHFYIVCYIVTTNFKNSVSKIDKAFSKTIGNVPLNVPLLGFGGGGCNSFTKIHTTSKTLKKILRIIRPPVLKFGPRRFGLALIF